MSDREPWRVLVDILPATARPHHESPQQADQVPCGAYTLVFTRSLLQHASQARIKRIMQKDEDVGKVAQATPVVICTFFCVLLAQRCP